MSNNITIESMIDFNINKELSYGLPEWFERIKSKTIQEVKEEDISRMIRQKLLIRPAVVEAVVRLRANPTGGLYDGELAYELSKIEKNFWLQNLNLSSALLRILDDIKQKDLVNNFDWISEEDAKEFMNSIETLTLRLNVAVKQ